MGVINDLKLEYKIGGVGTQLIFINTIIFIVSEIVFAILKLFNIYIDYLYYVSLWSNPENLLTYPWTIFTYLFFHNSLLHLVSNMLILYFTSRLFNTFFTQKQFLGLYILSGLFSGIAFIVGYNILPALVPVQTALVGASGAIMAILIAVTSYQPNMEVKLLGIFKLKLWYISVFIIFIDFIQLPMNNTGGHIAHISGALFGFIYVKLLLANIDLSLWVTNPINYIAQLFDVKKSTPFKKVHINPKPSKPTVTDNKTKIVIKNKSQQQIDEILDKISKSGYDSLTKEEKDFLFKVGKNE